MKHLELIYKIVRRRNYSLGYQGINGLEHSINQIFIDFFNENLEVNTAELLVFKDSYLSLHYSINPV